MIQGAIIGSRFERASFENFEVANANAKAVAACQRLVGGESSGLVLHGPVGVGKSHLLIAAAQAICGRYDSREEAGELVPLPSWREMVEQEAGGEDGPTVLDESDGVRPKDWIEYWPMLDLASELRAEVIRGELELSHRCRTCDLLILDDLGKEKVTEFVLQEFQRIVDWRYRDEKPIAVATNMTPKQIVERYGESTFSRWLESCEIVEIGGDDYRERKE